MTKDPIPQELRFWIEARRRFHLTDAQIQMARELGLNPGKFGGMANHKQEPWKMPLPDFIESLFVKRFKKEQPDSVKSIEEIAADRNRKKQERRERRRQEAASGQPEVKPRE